MSTVHSCARPMQRIEQLKGQAVERTGGGVGDVGRDVAGGDRFCCRNRSRPGGNTRRSSASAGGYSSAHNATRS